MIPDGRNFPGPVELIQHHAQYLDGFLTKPRIPCGRPNGTVPMAWPGVTMLELEQILLEEAELTHNLITVRTAEFAQKYRQRLLKLVCCSFCARQHICYSAYMLSQFWTDVCPSHRWISQKRLKLGSCNFHHRVVP